MNKLKIGIIGAGRIAEDRHICAIKSLVDDVSLTAVSDLNEKRLYEVAEKYQIPHLSTDYKDIFAYVDSVVICTPNKFHADIAIAALEAGVHVLCEKPMAMNVAECEGMVQAAEKSGKKLSVAYHYRYTEAARLAKETVDAGELGDVLVTRVQALRQRKVPGWGVFTNKALQGGGSLIDYGCHMLDLSLWLLGNPKPVEVMGRAYNRLSKMPGQINEWGALDHETFDVDDHVTGYITFSDGSSLMLECSWAANIKEDKMALSLSGVNGGMNVYPYELYKPDNGSMVMTERDAEHDEDAAGFEQMKRFVDSCLGRSELIVKPAEALQVNQIMDAIYQSSAEGVSIKL